MKPFKIILSILSITSSVFFAFAQTSNPTSTQTQVQKVASTVTTLATVNIYNATSTQKGNDFTVSFDITNRVGVQPSVKYGIMLVSESKGTQIPLDEHVYDEVLNLGEHSSIHKTVTYQAPLSLNGNYKLFVTSKNISGFPFGSAFVGDIKLRKIEGVSHLVVDTSSCFLTVAGEINKTKYTPFQGVDISLQENLQSNCVIENTSSSSITVIPSFVTRSRSSFGDMTSTTGGDFSPIAFLPHEKKIVTTLLPKGDKAQSYNIAVSYGEKSNQVEYRYVIQGGSGVIQNIVLDKDYYKKGDTADVSFLWVPSADSYSSSRKGVSGASSQVVSVVLLDKNDKPCNDIFTQSLTSKDSFVHFKIKTNRECFYGKVSVKLFDPKLNISDELSFENSSSTTFLISKKGDTVLNMILSVIIILLAVVLLVLAKKRKLFSSSTSSFIVCLVAISVLLNISTVKAESWKVTDYSFEGYGDVIQVTTGVSPSFVLQGGSINISCSTSPIYPGGAGRLEVYIDGWAGGNYFGTICNTGDWSGVGYPISDGMNVTASFPAGPHSINFLYMTQALNGVSGTYSSSITVTVPPSSCAAYSGTDPLTPTCVYNLNAPATPSGSSYTSYSVASPSGYTGSRTWSCSNGVWSPVSYVCTPPPPPSVYINFSLLDRIKSIFSSTFASTI